MRHGAVVVKAGRILGTGRNRTRVHDQWVTNRPRTLCTVHAECAAIRRVNAYRATVIVVRITKRGIVVGSRPCDTCWDVLTAAGVRRVVYS